MEALRRSIAPISFDVPPPIFQRNVIDQMAAKQIERRRREKEKNGYSSSSPSSSSSSDSDSASDIDSSAVRSIGPIDAHNLSPKQRRRIKKTERRHARNEAKQARKERKSSRKSQKREAKARGKQDKGHSREQKKTTKMEYIVVEKLEASSDRIMHEI